MDYKIEKPKSQIYKKWLFGVLGSIMIFFTVLYISKFITNDKSLRIEHQGLKIAEVKRGTVEDFIRLKATVEPKRTIYIDVSEGGRVEEKFVEEGVFVNKGQDILKLSNSSLQLGVITREAQITEQLNNLQNTKLAMAQDSLNLKSNQVEYEYQIKSLIRKKKNQKVLLEQKLIPEEEYLEVVDELDYFQKKLSITLMRIEQTKQLREIQMQQLEESTKSLVKNLEFTKKSLEELTIRAPESGYLTSLNVELGESLSRGKRIAQLDNINEFKFSAKVDEYYLNKVKAGQIATYTALGVKYKLLVRKVYLKVQDGQFKIDFSFDGNKPGSLHRGQSFQVKLNTATDKIALSIPKGGFFQETSGHWIYVLSDDGKYAIKREIKTGTTNPDSIEVVAGLSEGERVVVSSYADFKDFNTLTIVN